jgi:hypothetical protein
MAVTPSFSLPTSEMAFLVLKAREFDMEVAPSGLEDGSDLADDRAVSVLEDTADNPTEAELRSALAHLNEDQLAELLALVWIGRGDYDADDWKGALKGAREALNDRSVDYLVRTPNLADLLEEGLAAFDVSLAKDEDRLQ